MRAFLLRRRVSLLTSFEDVWRCRVGHDFGYCEKFIASSYMITTQDERATFARLRPVVQVLLSTSDDLRGLTPMKGAVLALNGYGKAVPEERRSTAGVHPPPDFLELLERFKIACRSRKSRLLKDVHSSSALTLADATAWTTDSSIKHPPPKFT
jgi:hypothetical protein